MAESESTSADLYLNLMRDILMRTVGAEDFVEVQYQKGSWQETVSAPFQWALEAKGYHLCRRPTWTQERRDAGVDWPPSAETMIGRRRMDNLRWCIETALRDGVPGDLAETGVWRGGACIFMRSVLKAYGVNDRKVWVCDSFEGLPKPTLEADMKWRFWRFKELAISLEEVQGNFRKYGLLDDNVRFLKGWFKDTLPDAPIESLAVLRLDGDLYESTRDAITALYPRLSPGGFLIVDDYGGIDSCRDAISDYRAANGIHEKIEKIDNSGVFWRKTG